MKTNNLDTGEYIRLISQKAHKLESRTKLAKTLRTVFLCFVILACAGGISAGIIFTSKSNETLYNAYLDSHDSTLLDNNLLLYRDTYEQFETISLGNKLSQSLAGGFFYEGNGYSVHPSAACDKMLLCSADTETTLCEGLASNISVKGNLVYYRKLDTRTVLSYNISDKTSSKLPLENVGQFIVCDNKIYYIDLSSSSLKAFDTETAEIDDIVASGVTAFIVLGNNVIYLDASHTLRELTLSNNIQTIIGKNISEFSHNGKIWMQNNDKVYRGTLDAKRLTAIELDVPCCRMLGVFGCNVYIESEDGIYIFDTQSNTSRKVSDGIFIGASDDELLVYDLSEGVYSLVKTAN